MREMTTGEYVEWYPEGYGMCFKVKRKIVDYRSKYQRIEIYETTNFGKMLVIDGAIQLVEEGEASYHEVIVHPAMLAHPSPERVLIIGGGDGGTLREVLKHPEVKRAVLVEIDPAVIHLSRLHLCIDRGSFDDERAEIVHDDGVRYLKSINGSFYDVIIVDSTDPVRHAKNLFTKDFYKCAKDVLREPGIIVTQAGSLYPLTNDFINTFNSMKAVFENTQILLSPVFGLASPWGFLVGVKGKLDFEHVDMRRARMLDLRFYDAEMHKFFLFLPKSVRKKLDGIVEGPP